MSEIGYACKTIGVPGAAVRTCTLATATHEKLREVTAHNLAALAVAVEYTATAGIRLFRISSDMVPFASHPAVDFPWRDMFADQMAGLGRRIKETGLRVSMHPGQYTVLNSPSDDVAERAIEDVVYHSDFLGLLGMDDTAKIVLHIGGVYGDRAAALERFRRRFELMPESARRRIVIENDEKCYGIDAVCALALELGVPAVLDTLHFSLLPPPEGDLSSWLRRAAATWKPGAGRQKIHYSQQLPHSRPGNHSLTIAIDEFLSFLPSLAGMDVEIMLEVKDKNLSAEKCLHCRNGASRSVLTSVWARYKYAVLEHDQRAYNSIRQQLKADAPNAVDFYRTIDRALATPPTPGGRLNTAEHVWGYFKKNASVTERARVYRLFPKAGEEPGFAAMKRFLFKLADKYHQDYLLHSLLFYLD